MLKGFLAMAITAVMSTVQAAPVISIGEMHKFIESNARTLLKQVSNTGTATAFVRIEVKEIVYENGKPVAPCQIVDWERPLEALRPRL